MVRIHIHNVMYEIMMIMDKEFDMNNNENVKIKLFFDKLYNKSVSKSISWFLMGIFISLIMISCLIPIQELLADTESPMLVPGVMTMISFMLVNARTIPYKQYTENQKTRMIQELLQYHPISKKAIWKLKMSDLLCFLAKVTGVGLVVQEIVALLAYKMLSWMNFFYVFLCVFLFPIIGELVFDSIIGSFMDE